MSDTESAVDEQVLVPASDASDVENAIVHEDSESETPLEDPIEASEILPSVAVSVAPEELSEITKDALSDHNFFNFISEKVLQFLSIIDIESIGARRSAFISICPNEDAITYRFNLASAFLHLQAAYGLEVGSPEMVDESTVYKEKMDRMKVWLGI